MTPVLQTLVTLTIRILLRLILLSQMSLTVSHNLLHMIDIILSVLARIFLGVLLQNCNNIAARVVTDSSAAAVVFRPSGSGGVFAAEPVLELLGGHVYELIELPGRWLWLDWKTFGSDSLVHGLIVFDHSY
jgi:hypothetical protein